MTILCAICSFLLIKPFRLLWLSGASLIASVFSVSFISISFILSFILFLISAISISFLTRFSFGLLLGVSSYLLPIIVIRQLWYGVSS